MYIEYFADGSQDCPLILLYGNDPNSALELLLAVKRLANGLVDRLAIHELPGFVSVGGCKLFARVGGWDMGIYPIAEVPAFEYSVEGLVIAIRRLIKYRIFRIFQEPVFECTLEKETWLDMINWLEPFTESSVMGHQYLTMCGEIDLLISPDRDW